MPSSSAVRGTAVDREFLGRVTKYCDARGLDVPVLIGSGVTPEIAADLLSLADGAIVGTALKHDGETTGPVDERAVARLVASIS